MEMRTRESIPATRIETVVDNLHGQAIADPYRWLEKSDDPETVRWVGEQNAYTRSLLDQVEGREAVHRRLTELFSIGAASAPAVRQGRYFFTRRTGHQNQPVLYVRDGSDEPERVLLDPNELSAEGMIALDFWYPSWDGRLLAYGCSANGDEWSTLFVLDVDSGELLPDRIERARYATVAWRPDKSGFYYSRYPYPGEVPEGEENYHKRVFFHALGADSRSDLEIVVPNLEREHMPFASISRDGRYLLVHVHKGSAASQTDVWMRDLAEDSELVPVAVGYDAYFGAQVVDGTLYLHTNLDAPRYHVFRTEAASPGRENWQEIIPEGQDVLETVSLVGGRVIGLYLHNATSALRVFEADGGRQFEVDLPLLGTVIAVTGEWESPEAFYSFESFTVPSTIYRLDLGDRERSVWAAVDAPLRADDYTVAQEWYISRDGTRVSTFLVHRTGLDRSRPHPTLLTGYGGFNVNRTPLFTRGIYLWLEHGGIYALPNLRGGGEYGEEWHRAGMLDRKQNVFDDFIAAAEYLIAQGYTDRSCLAIQGGSNGGLLVGVALTQRPDLFRAVVCSVPLLDMLRYQDFLIARLWIPEYGSAENPEQFPFLYAYSPYHQVKEGASYPAVLLETAESDTRVDPFHARKMAARLQAANASSHPILLRVETRAGHGAGKPLAKVVQEQTDIWTFLCWQLGMNRRG